MKIQRINAFFRKFGEFQLRHRAVFLVVICLVTVFCVAGLPKMTLSSNEEDWFDNTEQTKIDSDHFKDLFGADDSVMILVQADDVFAPNVLEAIGRISERLENEIPYAKNVMSLTNLSLPFGNEEGFEIINPFEDGVPDDPAELREKKEFILSRESIRNNLVSDDGRETWIILSLESYQKSLNEAMNEITPPAMKIVEEEASPDGSYTLKPTGMSYTEYEESVVTMHEMVLRVGIGFVVMLLCLVLFVRSLRGVIVPIIATGGAIGSVLGLNGWLGLVGDSNMVMLPILLSMALSVGYAIHYINSFRLHFRKTGRRRESVISSMEESGWPIFFTMVTTFAGLISFMFASIRPLRWVGGCSSACVFAVYVYVIIFIPIFMSFGKDKEVTDAASGKADKSGATRADLEFEKFGGGIVRHSKLVAAISAVIILGMIPGIFLTEVNMDYSEMMGRKIPYVARLLDIMEAKIGSQYSYNVLLEFGEEDALKSSDVMKRIDELSDKLATLNMTRISGDKPRVTSVTKIIKEMNRTLNEDDESYYAIPDDDDMVTQIMFLYEISGGDELFDWISDDYSTAYIHIEMNGYDAEKVVEDLENAKAFSAEIFPDAKTSIVGDVVNYAMMNGKIVFGELKSFIGSFIIILILMAIAFSSLHTGLIAMIPNLAPVLMIGGVMGYGHLALDMITMTVMPMILGIAVDDTIHFTNHIKYFYEKGLGYKGAVLSSYREIGKTMGMTTVILCSIFVILGFSPMACIGKLGWLSIIGLGSALVADYTLTPVLIYLTKPFGKDRPDGGNK